MSTIFRYVLWNNLFYQKTVEKPRRAEIPLQNHNVVIMLILYSYNIIGVHEPCFCRRSHVMLVRLFLLWFFKGLDKMTHTYLLNDAQKICALQKWLTSLSEEKSVNGHSRGQIEQ